MPTALHPLADSQTANILSPDATEDFHIPKGTMVACMSACRGRKNLAGRLSLALFSDEERENSNVRGVVGKKALDHLRVSAINSACIQEYPLQQGETKDKAHREIRISIDEACRRKKH